MAPDTVETIVREFIGVIRKDIKVAADLALVAEASAETGSFGKAVETANEIVGRAHDAGQLLNTLILIWRRLQPRSPHAEALDG